MQDTQEDISGETFKCFCFTFESTICSLWLKQEVLSLKVFSAEAEQVLLV